MSSNALISNFTKHVHLGICFFFSLGYFFFRFIEFSISINSVKYERIVLKFN